MSEFAQSFPLVPERYEEINENNLRSWYVSGDTRSRLFRVAMSLHEVGVSRDNPRAYDDTYENHRRILVDNVSPAYGPADMSDFERQKAAQQHLEYFLRSDGINVDPSVVRILRPDRDYKRGLQMVAIDKIADENRGQHPIFLPRQGDFIFTTDPEKVLAVRPADCPVVMAAGEEPGGETIYTMTHIAWLGAAHNYVGQMLEAYSYLNLNRDDMSFYISPGGQADTYEYSFKTDPRVQYPGADDLFPRPLLTTNGYEGHIDTPYFIYKQLARRVAPEQIFLDTTDTTAPEAGTSSHHRAADAGSREVESRDVVLMIPEDV